MQKNHNFDALDTSEFLFRDQLYVAINRRIDDHEMVEVLLVLCEFDYHWVVEDLHCGELIV